MSCALRGRVVSHLCNPSSLLTTFMAWSSEDSDPPTSDAEEEAAARQEDVQTRDATSGGVALTTPKLSSPLALPSPHSEDRRRRSPSRTPEERRLTALRLKRKRALTEFMADLQGCQSLASLRDAFRKAEQQAEDVLRALH